MSSSTSSQNGKKVVSSDKNLLLTSSSEDSDATMSTHKSASASVSPSSSNTELSALSSPSGLAAIALNRKNQGTIINTDDISTTDAVLMKAQQRTETLLREREELIATWWKYNMIIVVSSFILWWIFYLSLRFGFNLNDLGSFDIVNYDYQTSFFDVTMLFMANFLFVLLSTVTTFSDSERSMSLSIVGFWFSAFSVLMTIIKAVVLSRWNEVASAFLILIALAISFVVFAGQIQIKPLPEDAYGDADTADELAVKAARKAASEARTEEAAEIAKTLSGDALRAHLEKEEERMSSEQFVEKQELKAKLASRQKQQMKLTEYFILLKPYFWPDGWNHRGIVMLTWLALVLSKASSIISPIFIGDATNELVNEGTVPWGSIALYCSLQFASTAFKQTQSAVYLKVKQEAFVQLAKYSFVHVHSLSLSWHTKKKLGIVLRSLDRGIASADNVVSYLFLYLLPSMVECFIVFIIFYTKFDQPLLSAFILFFIVMYLVVTIQITVWRKKFRKATNKHDNEFHDRATDSLVNYETVKYFNNEQYETDRYVEAVRKYQKYSVSTQISLSILNTLQAMIIQGTLLCSLLTTAYHISKGQMSIGDFTAINAYTVNLFAPLSFLGSVYDMIVQSFVDMQNLAELLSEEVDVVDKVNATPLELKSTVKGAKLEFKNVCFSYGDQKSSKGISDVSFTVAPGTTTAIVGSTGAGKSTVGRLLFRFYDLRSGSIEIDGQSIADVTQKSLRETVGVVPQSTVMFNDTVLHNIQYGNRTATRTQVEAACKQAQILDFILGLPAQFDTKVGERGLRLSGGEAQRCSIARALLKDPPIVLLDEATSALDTTTEQEIQSALRSLEKNRTTLVIAHRLSTIRHAEQIIVMDSGRVIEKGTHNDLLEKNGKYAQLWNQQASELNEATSESTSESNETVAL